MSRIVVLNHQSLLAGGVAASLTGQSAQFDVLQLDSHSPETPGLITTYQPDIIIADSAEFTGDQPFSLLSLLEELTAITIIMLSTESDQMQIYSSRQEAADHLDKLWTAIQKAVH